jgi:NADPH:quinone reductase-like Zn-dependent oxidoreductase
LETVLPEFAVNSMSFISESFILSFSNRAKHYRARSALSLSILDIYSTSKEIIMSRKTVLVTTATGNVGSHVATLLLDQGFSVNALVRNPDSIAAQKLKEQGVSLFKGDFDVIPSIETAAEDVMVYLLMGFPR